MLSTNTQHWSLRWRSGIHVNAILGGGLFILSQPQGNSAPGLQVWEDLRAPARSKFNAQVQTRSTIGYPTLKSMELVLPIQQKHQEKIPLYMSHSQMLGKFEYGLPAKF